MNSPGAISRSRTCAMLQPPRTPRHRKPPRRPLRRWPARRKRKTASSTLVSDVNDLKLGSETLKVAVQDTQKKIISAESPSTIHYKGGQPHSRRLHRSSDGFPASALPAADINTPFNSIPYPGNALGKVTENNFTARQIPPHVAGRNHDWQRQGDWLLRRRFPRGRHHFQQPARATAMSSASGNCGPTLLGRTVSKLLEARCGAW